MGQGLAELLVEKRVSISRDYGLEFSVVGISDKLKGSVYSREGIDLEKALQVVAKGGSLSSLPDAFSGDAPSMIQEADADVMVEVTYTDLKTAEPATTHIRAAMERGMHVVTSNKGPPALHYRELRSLADRAGVRFLFEGTVMSGTPLLNLIRENLAGCAISEIRGIVNGTTNYILTRMEEGQTYEAALRKAQELGYAEVVPDADVLGWDALAKVTILANVVFGQALKPFDQPCVGITDITPADIAAARKRGKRYKLIGRVWEEEGRVKVSVGPEEVELTDPLASVGGATNALTISTDTLGDVTIVGPGAGKRETGYSLLIDLLHIGGVS